MGPWIPASLGREKGMRRLRLLNVRRALGLALIGSIVTLVAGVAFATMGSGVTSQAFARGTLDPFKIKLKDSSKPGDVLVVRFEIAPGGYSGWHYHPGPAVVTIKSGEVTFVQARDCSSATFSVGQATVEPTEQVHEARNTGTVKAEFWVTFLDVPVGSPPRIEAETDPRWQDPGC